MINLKDELLKYKPVLGLEDVEAAVQDENTDLLAMLRFLTQAQKGATTP